MIIKIENLSKKYKTKKKENLIRNLFFPRYKDILAVDKATFSIEKGESVALLGPNGAGKTTIMKLLTGLLYPTEGNVSILGFFPFDRKSDFLKKIGLVMGNKSGLAWDLTPEQNFQLIKKIYRINDLVFKERLTNLLDMLNVSEFADKQVRKLSLGERMKMELIASILHSPEILFLDEPTIGLDIVSKQRIRGFLRDIQQNSEVTLLLTSHDMDDVERVVDRVIIINHGQIVFDGSMNNLLYKYRNKKYLTILFTEKVKADEIKKYGKIIERKPLSYTLEIKAEDQPQILATISEKLPVDDIDIVHVPLEEIISDMFTTPKPKENI